MLRKVCTTVKNCRQASLSLSRTFAKKADFAHPEKCLILLRFVSKRGIDFNVISTAFSPQKVGSRTINFGPKIT
jgi:hypothetical protein